MTEEKRKVGRPRKPRPLSVYEQWERKEPRRMYLCNCCGYYNLIEESNFSVSKCYNCGRNSFEKISMKEQLDFFDKLQN